jgi:hypothetical protein
VPNKSWQNTLTAEESAIADQLYEKVLDLKNAEGQTMCGTEVVTVFLKCRMQPVMSRVHQLWLYTGAKDKSRVSPTDFSEEYLWDEVRRLTYIVMTLAHPPLDIKHLPSEVIVLFVSAYDVIFASESKICYFTFDRLLLLLNAIHRHPKLE